MKGKGGMAKAAGLFCAALAAAALWAPGAGAVERPPGGCHAGAGPAEPGLKLRVGWLAPAQAYTAGGPAMRTFIGVDTPMRTGADSHRKAVFDRNGAEWTAGAYIPVVHTPPEALYAPDIHYLDGTSFFDKSAGDKSKKPMSNREWHEFLRRMAEDMKAEKQAAWDRAALPGLTWQIGAVSSGSEHGFAKKFVGVDAYNWIPDCSLGGRRRGRSVSASGARHRQDGLRLLTAARRSLPKPASRTRPAAAFTSPRRPARG